MTFGEFFSQKRKEKCLTQKELANKLYVSESAVSKWEKNVARPDISLLPTLAEILGVTEHELITASIDQVTRSTTKNARRWTNLTKTWHVFFAISYAIALLTCFIVNLAVNKTLSWFWIVFASITLSATFTNTPHLITKCRLVLIPTSQFAALILLFAVCNIYCKTNWFWLATLPTGVGLLTVFLPIVFAKCKLPTFFAKHNAVISITIDYAMLLIMQLVICAVTGGNWFATLSLPFTTIGFVTALAMAINSRYARYNALIKTAVNIAVVLAVFVIVGYTSFAILGNAGVDLTDTTPFAPFNANFSVWSDEYVNYNVTAIILLSMSALTVLFAVIGIIKQQKDE